MVWVKLTESFSGGEMEIHLNLDHVVSIQPTGDGKTTTICHLSTNTTDRLRVIETPSDIFRKISEASNA